MSGLTNINGFLGQAARFENAGGSGLADDWALTLGNIDALYAHDCSVSLWLRCAGSMNAAVLANRPLTNDANVGWGVGALDGHNVSWTAVGSLPRRVDLHPPLLDGAWHLVTATFNRGANELLTYLDGRLHGATNISASGLAPLSAGWPTLVGAGADGAYAAQADVDDLGIWRRTLAPAEVAELYDKGQRGMALLDPYTPPPVIVSAPASQTVFPGAPARFSVAAFGSGLAYQWQRDKVAVVGATNDMLSFSAVQPADAGSYTVTVANAAGSVTSAAATLRVLAPPLGATSLAIDLTAYYTFDAHAGGIVSNAVRAAGYPGFAQDEAVLCGAEEIGEAPGMARSLRILVVGRHEAEAERAQAGGKPG